MNGTAVLEPSARKGRKVVVKTNGQGPLNAIERQTFGALEQVISHHFETYKETGAALSKIRDGRLYREHYSTFEEYCREKWGMTKTQGNRLIAAANVATSLAAQASPKEAKIAGKLTESAVRPLTLLKPPQQRKVLRQVAKQAPTMRGVTAKLVEQVAREVAPEAFHRRAAATPAATKRAVDTADLVRKSEVVEEIAKWEKVQKRAGNLAGMSAHEVVRNILEIVRNI